METLTDRRTSRTVPFNIDGRPYETNELRQPAAALLRLADLDPALYDLGELRGKKPVHTQRFKSDQIVDVNEQARFVSIRHSAQIA